MYHAKALFVYWKNPRDDAKARVRYLTELLKRQGLLGVPMEVQEGKTLPELAEELLPDFQNVVFMLFWNDAKEEEGCRQLAQVLRMAKERQKKIVVIPDFDGLLGKNPLLAGFAEEKHIIRLQDGLHTEEERDKACAALLSWFRADQDKQMLYTLLAEQLRLGYRSAASETLCRILQMISGERKQTGDPQALRELWKEMDRVVQKLDENTMLEVVSGDPQASERNHFVFDTAGMVHNILHEAAFPPEDLFLHAMAIRMEAAILSIHETCMWNGTSGDLEHYAPEVIERNYFCHQKKHFEFLEHPVSGALERYPEDELEVIRQAPSEMLDRNREIRRPEPDQTEKPESVPNLPQLQQIANHLEESSRLFSELADADEAADFLKCLKTGYERLKLYCETVNCREVCMTCTTRILELNLQMDLMERKGADSCASQGLKALLGLTMPGSREYDVFLSYSHQVKDIAKQVYHMLQKYMLVPFMDAMTLPELGKAEYEEAIMDAMEHSRHFALILSDLRQLESPWIRYEMMTFHREVIEGRKKEANLVILATDSVCKEIFASNKTVLPIQFRGYEIFPLSTYEHQIPKYFK